MSTTKTTQTFSLDKEVLAAVKRTRGTRSASERVNDLLKFALELERKAALHEEAAVFFADAPDDAAERRAYQTASIRSWSRD